MPSELKLEGRSGCRIALVDVNGHLRVRKYSRNVSYNDRLWKQVRKQRLFWSATRSPGTFSTPEVLATGLELETGLAWFEMDYIAGSAFGEHLLRCTASDLDDFVASLVEIIDGELACSIPMEIGPEDIEEKLHELQDQLIAKGLQNSLSARTAGSLLRDIPSGPLPIGTCHGDLTLSNMIIRDDGVCLLDFLDSFVETPLMDLIKIRQDTKYNWSTLIDTAIAPHHMIRIRQALRYMDRRLDAYTAGLVQYLRWYRFLEAVNLIRIVPYLSIPAEIQFIEECLVVAVGELQAAGRRVVALHILGTDRTGARLDESHETG